MNIKNDLHGTSIKLPPALLKALDKWRRQQLREPSRSDAIRYMIEIFLKEKEQVKND